MKIFKTEFNMLIIAGILLFSIGFVLYSSDHIGAESESKGQIAYVDLWAVFNVHPEKSTAESELNKLAQSMQTELEEKAKDLPNEKQQDLLKEYQTKLSQREQELIQNIIDSIKDVVVEVAKEKEVKMVLDKKNVIYGGYNMTEDVIAYIGETIGETVQEGENTIEEGSIEENTLEDGSIIEENEGNNAVD